MINGNSSNKRRDTREMRLRNRHSDSNDFNKYNRLFGNDITRLSKRKQKAERKILVWKKEKEEFEKKDEGEIKKEERKNRRKTCRGREENKRKTKRIST